MLLKLYQAGQPVLRRTAKRLTKAQLATPTTQQVIDFMINTLRDAPGVGLAAPQVGEALQIIIIEDKAKYHDQVDPKLFKEQRRHVVQLKVLVNPVIEVVDAEQDVYFEGCLSVDGYVAVVPRARKVRVRGWDRRAKEVVITAEGWCARILQHEMDHLQGKLLTDVMRPTSLMTAKKLHYVIPKIFAEHVAQEI